MQLKWSILISVFTLAINQALFAGGFVLSGTDRNYLNQTLELNKEQATVSIYDLAAQTEIKQVFKNPTKHRLEGYFYFPVPEGAVISDFTMMINGQEKKAELLDAGKAKQIYEQIVRSLKDPALLEYANQSLFKVRIFPILPGSETEVKLIYNEILSTNNGTVAYEYPFSHSDKSKAQIGQFGFEVQLESSDALKNIYSPTHEMEIIRKGNQKARLGLERSQLSADQNIHLFYKSHQSFVGASVVAGRGIKDDRFFMLHFDPGYINEDQVFEKDITFVLDASGSMDGKKMEQAKAALHYCIDHLSEGDRFQIVQFATEADALFDRLTPANEESLAEACVYIDQIEALGSTNIEEALRLSLNDANSNRQRPEYVVLLTDGEPTIGETNTDRLLSMVENLNTVNKRVFTFGVGNELNTHLLDKITKMTKAYRSYIKPEENIDVKVSEFYNKISAPVLSDIKVEIEGVSTSSVYPKEIPDLFKGSSVSLMGKMAKSGKATVKVNAVHNGEEISFNYPVEFIADESKPFLGELWANRAVGYLLDQIRLHGENEEIKSSVVKIAKQYGIVTPYTSYLIVEDERQIAREMPEMTFNLMDVVTQGRTYSPVIEEVEEEYESMFETKSAKSVASSQNIQQQNNMNYLSDKEVIGYDGAFNDVVMNNGRAFFNNNNVWVDSEIQNNMHLKLNRIEFASEDYYNLLKNEPEAASYLALGNNIKFVFNNQIYEIYEK